MSCNHHLRPPSTKRFPLRAIVIEGNEHFPTDAIVEVTGLKLGQRVADADFRRAIGKLRDTGAFEVYEYRFTPHEGGYRITFKLQEASPLYPLRMEGFGATDEELRALLEEKVPLIGKMVPAAGTMIDRIGAVLQHFWRKAGNRSKVVGSLAPFGEGEFEMLFSPRSAIKTIAFATFENTGELSPLDLQRVFNQIAMGVLYSESRLKEMLHYNIRPLYEEKGRLDVTFCPCRADPDPDSEGLLVSIEVRQGEVYTFNSVELEETSAVHHELLDSLIQINQGEKADLARVRKAIADIERLLKANGFMNAVGSFDRELDTEAKTVDVIIEVERGDRYTFNKLTIQGLDIIGEAAVRKKMGHQLRRSLQRQLPTKVSEPNHPRRHVRQAFQNGLETEDPPGHQNRGHHPHLRLGRRVSSRPRRRYLGFVPGVCLCRTTSTPPPSSHPRPRPALHTTL